MATRNPLGKGLADLTREGDRASVDKLTTNRSPLQVSLSREEIGALLVPTAASYSDRINAERKLMAAIGIED